MDWLEDFFARRKITEGAIEVIGFEDTLSPEKEFAERRRSLTRTRRVLRRSATHRKQIISTKEPLPQKPKWVMVPLVDGQPWWIALLSLSALGTQAHYADYLSHDFVQISVELLAESLKL